MTGFKDLGINEDLGKVLAKEGIVSPTPVQEKTISDILSGRDVVAQAQTGTGKTLAFLLPMIQKIDLEKHKIQGLIITPTRELALQITNEAKKFQEARDIKILAVYGGQDVEAQMKKLKGGIHLVIATPGRLLDHLRRGNIDFGKLNSLVLDEADEMLRMGFLEDVEKIIVGTPKTRQTMLFSATIPNEVRSLSKRFMKDPLQIEIAAKNTTLEEIEQVVIETSDRRKLDNLCSLIDEYRPYLAIVFCRTKRRVKSLNEELLYRGYNSGELHGDLSQAKRERVIRSFREAKLLILVATDIVSRGIDVEGVSHVVNYDIPDSVDSYIHRIGRTGRIGNLGMAITFVTDRDRDEFALIRRKLNADIGQKEMKREKLKPRSKDNHVKDRSKDERKNKREYKKPGKKSSRAGKSNSPRYSSKKKKKGKRK